MKDEYLTIKYKLFGQAYFQTVKGTYQFEENALAKVKEIARDQSVSSIVVHKRKGYKSLLIYSWTNGFECVYLNRRFSS